MTKEISYEIFDVQLGAFLGMCEILVDTWESNSSLEHSLDLKSLTLKGERLCAMADADWAQQQCDITFSRRQSNEEYLFEIVAFIKDRFWPFCVKEITNLGEQNTIENNQWRERMPSTLQLFQILSKELAAEENGAEVSEMFARYLVGIEMAAKSSSTGVQYPDLQPMQCLWLMMKLATYLVYLTLHFGRAKSLCEKEIPEEEAGVNMQRCIHWYETSEQGSEELQRYKEALEFDNGGPLNIAELKAARKELRKIVPDVFQRIFMHHLNSIEDLGRAWNGIDALKEDNLKLVEALAKWQLLTKEIAALQHPELIEPELCNTVFNTMLHERRINMLELRERIERMLQYVSKKGQWICVWCVLNYNNMLKNKSLSAFAQQMMHEDWFGVSGHLSFNVDNINEYSGYFTNTLFPLWSQDSYMAERKERWSDNLCSRFLEICRKMNEAFRE